MDYAAYFLNTWGNGPKPGQIVYDISMSSDSEGESQTGVTVIYV